MARRRTNIVVDDQLMRQVLTATGIKTMREAVDLALRFLPRLKSQQRIHASRGTLRWTGKLERMRRDR